MPFAQIQYRMLRDSPLLWEERRRRFLCRSISYILMFLIIGTGFLALFLIEKNRLDSYDCSICNTYGTPYSCGYQQCCASPDGTTDYDFNSYQYCLGNFWEGIAAIVTVVCYGYVIYESFMVCCILCTKPAFRNGQDVVVMGNNGQMMGINGMGINGGGMVGLTTNFNSPYANNNPMNSNNLSPNPMNNNNNMAKDFTNE